MKKFVDFLNSEVCKMEQFRIDEQTGSVYELNSRGDAYLFIGKLNGRTKKKFFIDLLETHEANDDLENEG